MYLSHVNTSRAHCSSTEKRREREESTVSPLHECIGSCMQHGSTAQCLVEEEGDRLNVATKTKKQHLPSAQEAVHSLARLSAPLCTTALPPSHTLQSCYCVLAFVCSLPVQCIRKERERGCKVAWRGSCSWEREAHPLRANAEREERLLSRIVLSCCLRCCKALCPTNCSLQRFQPRPVLCPRPSRSPPSLTELSPPSLLALARSLALVSRTRPLRTLLYYGLYGCVYTHCLSLQRFALQTPVS